MRKAEQDCSSLGVTTAMLMENAGHDAAHEIKRILGFVQQKQIVVLVGPGNNGGDGLVAARYLRDWGAHITIVLLARRPAEDENVAAVLARGVAVVDMSAVGSRASLEWLLSPSTDAVIDAVFGTGKIRPLRGTIATVMDEINAFKIRHPSLHVIAIDLPSGLDADNGGVDPHTLFADNTLTLAFPKQGLFLFPGAERTGAISIVNIGIPSSLVENGPDDLITASWVKAALPKRQKGANKGTFGKVLVAGGSTKYPGAACLACSGAMRSGAGLVTLAAPSSLYPVLASKLTETTHLPLPGAEPGIITEEASTEILAEMGNFGVFLIGCGLGQHSSTARFVESVLMKKKLGIPAVIDADALNILSGKKYWYKKLPGNTVLTPHPGEFARLTGLSVDEIQANRINIAREKAVQWKTTIVLKGAYTVIASSDGRCRVAPFANPGLATAGTGDILAGVIAGLIAQGMPIADAAACGVYIHAATGESVKERAGEAGMIASDLLPEIPISIKRLTTGAI